MDTFEAIETRRAVKHFDPDFALADEQQRELLSAAMLSPTSFNIQNWRFVNVKDPELREKIKAAAFGQAQVTEASMLLLICGDLLAHSRDPERYWRNAPEQVRASVVSMIGQFYDGNEQLQRDETMRSAGIAAQTLMLAAKSRGLDSGPMIGFDPVKVAELINLPKDHVICMMLVIGKAKQPARPRGGQLAYDEVVVTDRF